MKRSLYQRPFPENRPVALCPGLWGGRHSQDGVAGYLIYDPVHHRQTFLEGALAEAVAALGRGRVAEKLPLPLKDAARELWRRGLLALAPGEEAPAPQPVKPKTKGFVTRPGASFTCQRCGLCCRALLPLGPVSPEEQPRILRAAEQLGRPLSRPPLSLSPPERPDGPWRYQLATQKGRCVFLTRETRCALHQALGAEGKPLSCQTFPLQLIQVGDELRGIASSRCPSVALSEGAPLTAEIFADLARKDAPLRGTPEPECGWEAYQEAEKRLLAELNPEEGPPAPPQAALESFLARLGLSLKEPPPPGLWYRLLNRLRQEHHLTAGGDILKAAAWSLSWCLGRRGRHPARPWADAITHAAPERSAEHILARYLADQVFAGALLTSPPLEDAAWRLLRKSERIQGHARALQQAGLAREPFATAEAIYVWDVAAESSAWEKLRPLQAQEGEP